MTVDSCLYSTNTTYDKLGLSVFSSRIYSRSDILKRIVLMFFFLIILASCSQSTGIHNKELEKSISSAMEKEGVEKIDVNSLTDFNWEKAYIFTPYTTQETISEQLGVNYKDPSNLYYRDDINLIVFLDNNKVVQYVEITRKFGDLLIETDDGFTPLDATLKIKNN